MRIDTYGELSAVRELLAVLFHKALPVRLRSPLRVVKDAGAVGAAVQRCPNQARLLLHCFDEVHPMLNQCLLLLRGRLEDIDQCDQMALAGNAHSFPPWSPRLS